jgi:hypothetical protein
LVFAAAWFGWSRYQAGVSAARYRRLTSCQVAGCEAGVPCAVACARQFLERNGYGDAALGQKDWMVFDIIEGRNGESVDEILAFRANTVATKPVYVCRTATGYEVLFSKPEESKKDLSRQAQLEGRLVTMNADLANVHLVHTPIIHVREPDSKDCAFIP